MTIPDYQTIMLPLLKAIRDGKEHSKQNIVEKLSDEFRLSDEDRKKLLPSGQRIFDNRVGWGRTYLKKAGLLENTRRGHFKISPKGLSTLAENLSELNNKYLERFPEFVDFINSSKSSSLRTTSADISNNSSRRTPEESLEEGYQEINETLAQDLLSKVKSCSPDFFETLVVELLLKMGYGGSREDAGAAIGKTGDGGIDGIINEDRLGLDKIYIQAKRWEGSVGRPEIQKFVGALQGQSAGKGIFITTSRFTDEATSYVRALNGKMVLIDGYYLSHLMIEHNIGVSHIATYDIKKLDLDYFEDEI